MKSQFFRYLSLFLSTALCYAADESPSYRRASTHVLTAHRQDSGLGPEFSPDCKQAREKDPFFGFEPVTEEETDTFNTQLPPRPASAPPSSKTHLRRRGAVSNLADIFRRESPKDEQRLDSPATLRAACLTALTNLQKIGPTAYTDNHITSCGDNQQKLYALRKDLEQFCQDRLNAQKSKNKPFARVYFAGPSGEKDRLLPAETFPIDPYEKSYTAEDYLRFKFYITFDNAIYFWQQQAKGAIQDFSIHFPQAKLGQEIEDLNKTASTLNEYQRLFWLIAYRIDDILAEENRANPNSNQSDSE